ncbi:hypothetical protein GQ600_7508 [Phytophthora cactorum]|nr:hypothetical protein GQ600_7508 [Phytophthora cactorum]
MTQLPSGTMVNLGGESKQELFDGGLVWCDERAMLKYERTVNPSLRVTMQRDLRQRGTRTSRTERVVQNLPICSEVDTGKVLCRSWPKGRLITVFNDTRTSHNSAHAALFEHFPEVLVADDTHDTNSSDYKLFSFMVHDAMGKGQHVQVSCASNPRCIQHRRIDQERNEELLMSAPTETVYDNIIATMKVVLRLDEKVKLWFTYFDLNWKSSVQGGARCFEALVNRSTALDDRVVSILFWQTVNEKIWARNIKRIGVMSLLLSTVSRHAVELVKQQYDFVLLSTTEYRHYPMGPYVMMQYSA